MLKQKWKQINKNLKNIARVWQVESFHLPFINEVNVWLIWTRFLEHIRASASAGDESTGTRNASQGGCWRPHCIALGLAVVPTLSLLKPHVLGVATSFSPLSGHLGLVWLQWPASNWLKTAEGFQSLRSISFHTLSWEASILPPDHHYPVLRRPPVPVS